MPDSAPSPELPASVREVRFEYSRDFLPLLDQLGASLLVSTYQAGKLIVVSVVNGALRLTFHNFEQAMGIAAGSHQLAVGTARQIWFLNRADDALHETSTTDSNASWVTRTSFVTGNIHCHDMSWGADGLWVVNTLFSNLSTLHPDYSWVPRWQPRFITALQPEDRCHLNGLAIENGQPRYVTAMSETDTRQGWRPTKAVSGVVMDVPSRETVARGFAMPHSPRIHENRLFVLNSGLGDLSVVDPSNGQITAIEQFPGYTRGLSFCGPFAFVGLSRIRETSTFDGIPIAEQREHLRCGVAVADLRSGKAVAYLEFKSGVEEIFDVQVLPGIRDVNLVGPHIQQDGTRELWIVPSPDRVPLIKGGLGSAAGI